MAVISMKQLLEAGVHFGHQTRRWNPKMAQYIFTERNGIYIIDLQKTVRKADEAYNFVRDLAMSGKSILFVGTKKQAQESIAAEAQRCNMFYVNNRWLGGMLTNFRTIRTRVDRLNQIDRMEQQGQFDVLPKKEVIRLQHEREKLEANLGGIREMKKLPGAQFVVDPRKEHIAVSEARALGIPIVALRSRRDRLRHSGQRRRHPRREADCRQAGRRRARRPSGRAGRPGRGRSRRGSRQGRSVSLCGRAQALPFRFMISQARRGL